VKELENRFSNRRRTEGTATQPFLPREQEGAAKRKGRKYRLKEYHLLWRERGGRGH